MREFTGRTDEEGAKDAIVALNDAWAEAFMDHDLEGLAHLFTDDGVRMPNGGNTAVGMQAIEEQYRKEFAPLEGMRYSASIDTDEVIVSGDYAFARGTDTVTFEMEGGAVSETGKWMATYRREPDGSWKYLWSTYNSNGPA